MAFIVLSKTAKWTVIAGTVIVMAGLFSFFLLNDSDYPRDAMNCTIVEPHQLDALRAELETVPLYEPGAEGRATVIMQLAPAQKIEGEALMVITSNRLNAAVYRGPYQPRLDLQMDAALADDEGYDNLEFQLLLPNENKVCRASNERGYPYWQPGKRITLRFLENAAYDEDELRMGFEVVIE